MSHTPAQPTPLPRFERPAEAVVYWTLEKLCGGAGGRYLLPLPQLARHCGLAVSTTNQAVLRLAQRGVIGYRRGYNQARPSLFELPLPGSPCGNLRAFPQGRGEKLSPKTTGQSKIGPPTPSDDNDNIINNLYICDKDDREAIHKQGEERDQDNAAERLAYRIASGLEDLKNLALYRSYCRKFPVEMVLKAFSQARETPASKIKVSRGALFNFLVQHYAKRTNKNHPGAETR